MFERENCIYTMGNLDIFGKEIEYFEKYENKSNFAFEEANKNWVVYSSEVSSHTFESQPYLIPTVSLIFVGAMYVEMPNYFDGVKITKPNDERSLELAKKFDKGYEYLESSERVYKIESQNNSFYIVAANLWIHEHNCQYQESFIEKFNYSDYLHEKVRNWIKLK